ncbi:MAG: AMP-binding protein [Candidatus Margulisiibacteriota bacterium]
MDISTDSPNRILEEAWCPIAYWAKETPLATALIHQNQPISYNKFNEDILATCDTLKHQTEAGMTAFLTATPIPYTTFVGLFASFRLRKCALLLNPTLGQQALSDILEKTTQLPPVHFPCDPLHQSVSFTETEPALCLTTSGSTGSPKAVLLSWQNCLYSALGAIPVLNISQNDTTLLSLPLYHVSGLGALFRTFLTGGALIVPAQKEPIIDALARYNPNHISIVHPQLLDLLANPDAPWKTPLKSVLVGGGPIVTQRIEEGVRAGFPLFTTYGLTETTALVSLEQSALAHPITSGTVLEHRHIHRYEDGEMGVKGNTLFLGYLQDSGKIDCPIDENGWFRTGDMGHFTHSGRLVITGRKDNQFISGGENCYPEEIETALLALPGVQKAVVLPVPHPRYGQVPVAWVLQTPLDSQALKQALAKHLPPFKIPKHFFPYPEELAFGLKPKREWFRAQLPKDPLF